MRAQFAISTLALLVLTLVASISPASAVTDTFACADFRTGPGIITGGSYWDTHGIDDGITEDLQEGLVNGISHLTHVWKFCSVPAGTQSIVLEGTRVLGPDGDNFQFSYALGCDSTVYQTIPNASIKKPFYPLGGQTYSMNITTSATVDFYIMINDTAAGGNLDTVKVDYLAIHTTP